MNAHRGPPFSPESRRLRALAIASARDSSLVSSSAWRSPYFFRAVTRSACGRSPSAAIGGPESVSVTVKAFRFEPLLLFRLDHAVVIALRFVADGVAGIKLIVEPVSLR